VERRKKVKGPDGRMVDAVELSFRSSGENWNEYLLDDGTVIRVKLVVTDVVRLDGQYDQVGNPVYLVQSTNVLAVSAADKLRKDLGGSGS